MLPRILTTLLTLLPGMGTFAQTAAPGWMENTMFGSGKINTVVAVVSIVLLGLATWMFMMDRRLRRMEERTKNK